MLVDYDVVSPLTDGAHVKYWVRLSDGRQGLYKENKGDTYENVSEYLATIIGNLLCIPMCNVILLTNATISISTATAPLTSFIAYSEEFSPSYHLSNLSTFNISSLLNPDNNKYIKEVVDMLLLDILIGNSDRHPGNFSLVDNEFYPLYDNGSSLCAYVPEKDIESIMRDKMRWKALMYSKSKPVLRDDQRITNYELLQQLRHLKPELVNDFANRLYHLNIQGVLMLISECISNNRYKLLYRFLSERKEWFYE